MRTIATGRVNRAAAKVGDQAPMATVCRTCLPTNAIALGLAAVMGADAWIAKLFRRSASA